MLIPKGWYSATITQSYIVEIKGNKRLKVCFTIDSGDHSYKHIIREYPLTDSGLERLELNFLEIGFFIYRNYRKPLFTEQFIKLRAMVHVDREKVGDVITNFILEMKKPQDEPEHDVSRPKSEDHFHERNKGRKLPCQNSDSGTTKTKQFKK
jgi:hypothetical protein